MGLKSWWKSLWEGNPNVDENGLPRLAETVPISEVKPPKPEKDISEPVLSFIKLYKENPRNFRVVRKTEHLDYSTKYVYSIFDRINSKLFTAYKMQYYMYSGDRDWYAQINTGWATQDEMQEVFDVILEERISRYKLLKDKRHSLQRKRLTKLYKGE